MSQITTKINVAGLEHMSKEVRDGLRSAKPGPMRDALKQWAVRYRAAMQSRFDKFSKGGGSWPGLADSTKARRRHGHGGKYKRGHRAYAKAKATGGGMISILRDTGQLFAVLTPVFKRLPGQSQKDVPFGITVGFQGPGRKKIRGGGTSKATIREVAEFHHAGMGRNPKRTLLADPSDDLKKQMAGDMERAIERVIRQSQVPKV